MGARPKILHISTSAHPRNGVGQTIHDIHRYADEFGYRSFVFSGTGDKMHCDMVALGKAAYLVNVLRARLWRNDGFVPTPGFRRLLKGILALEPDIVHLHNLHGYFSHLPSLRKTLDELGIPVVITFHDLWFATGRCAVPPLSCRQNLMDNHCDRCRHKHLYPSKWLGNCNHMALKKQFLEGFTTVVPSNWMKKHFNSQAIVIPNGVNMSIFKPRQNTNEQQNFRILAIASKWNESKGIDELFALADAMPDQFTMTLIGHNAPKHPKINRLGFIEDPSVMAREMAEARVVLSASHFESYGRTIAEAVSVGTPVVVKAGTAPEDFAGGHVSSVDFSSPHKVIEAIVNIDRITPGKGTEEIICSYKSAKRYYALYDKLLSRHCPFPYPRRP